MDVPRSFSFSEAIDNDGELVRYYHGTTSEVETLDTKKTVDGGIHFGTLEQASMRSAGDKKRLIEVVLNIRKPRRSRDEGDGWRSKIKSAKSAGYDSIVYLNRWENISSETISKAEQRGVELDRLSDAEFRKFAPEAQDSFIVFEVSQFFVLDNNFKIHSVVEEVGEVASPPCKKKSSFPRP